MSKYQLLAEIEKCRKDMIALSDTHELTSKEIISQSEQLDKLINDYQQFAQ